VGLLDVVERSGERVVTGSCPLYLPIDRWGFSVLMTGSTERAYYAPNLVNVDAVFKDSLGA